MADMTQAEFNAMLQIALAQGLPGGIYTSKFGRGEDIDAALDAAWAVRNLGNINLLDNPDFTINQRGVSGTIFTPGYFLDRWKLTSGSVTISSGGITLNGTIQQILETAPSGTLTASYLTNSGVQKASYDSASKTFSITASNVLIKAAKLELGSVQTLAHLDGSTWVLNDPPPNKALELAKCQRYFIRMKESANRTYGGTLGSNFAYTSARIFEHILLPVTLRANPTITVSGQLQLQHISTRIDVDSAEFYRRSPNGITLDCRVPDGLLVPGDVYELNFGNSAGSYIDISCEL